VQIQKGFHPLYAIQNYIRVTFLKLRSSFQLPLGKLLIPSANHQFWFVDHNTTFTSSIMNNDMKKLLLLFVPVVSMINAGSQNVGIGTAAPSHKLHVIGEVVASDYIHAASYLRAGNSAFSNSYRLQINNGNSLLGGKLFVGGTAPANEQLYVSGPGGAGTSARFANGNVIVENDFVASGNTAIGGALDNNYKLRVYDGNARIGGDFHATGNAAIGGSVDNNFRLRIYDGNARVGGNAEITGQLTAGLAAIGGSIDDNFRLRIYDGNFRVGGNAEITGQLTAGSVAIDNTLTIGGNGSVRSNGISPLRIGFDSKTVDVYIANNARVSVTANITDFSGGLDDIRVMISHVVNDDGGLPWPEMILTVMGPNSGSDTCLIWITNKSGENGTLKGTIYLTSIAKN
jgi:hypothetical protein